MKRTTIRSSVAKAALTGRDSRAAISKQTGDVALFQEAVRDAQAIAVADRVPISRQAPVAIKSAGDDFDPIDALPYARVAGDLSLEADAGSSFVRDGYPPVTMRRLRRGEWPIEDELDLHGARQHEAHTLLGNFLNRTGRGRRHCVRIIHGKGHGSVDRVPVLKIAVRRWLARRDDVIAYCEAPPAMGGAGALLVLLKR